MSKIIIPGRTDISRDALEHMMSEADHEDEKAELRGQIQHLAECLKQSQNVLFLVVQAAGGSVTIDPEAVCRMKPTDRLRQATDADGEITLTAETELPTENTTWN